MANESFSFEEAIGLSQKPQSGGAAAGGSFSFEEALGRPVQATPGFIPTIKRTGGQMLTTAATTAEDVVGPNAVTQAMREAGQGIIDRNPAGITKPGDVVDKPWLAVKEATGNYAPQIAAGAAGAAAGASLGALAGLVGAAIGGVAGSLLPIFTQEYGGIRQEQKQSGQEDKARALAAAIPATALERFGMGKALKVLKGVPSGTAGSILKEAGKGVLKEGATEGTQNVIEQVGAFKDPTASGNLEDTALSAVMGGIGGGVMGSAAGAVDGARYRTQQREQAQATQRAQEAIDSADRLAEEARNTQPMMLGNSAPDRLYVFPDGTVGRTGEVESYLANLPEDQRAEARARLMGQHYTEVNDPQAQQARRWWENYGDGASAQPRPDYLAEVQQAVRAGTPYSTQQTVDTVRNAMEDVWLEQNVGVAEDGAQPAQAADTVGAQLQDAFEQGGGDAAIAAVDARVRTGRILSGLQNILDAGADNSAQVLGNLNDGLTRINEAPLSQDEVARVRRMLDARAAFTGQTTPAALPDTAPPVVDRHADNAVMEALIPERPSQRMGLRSGPEAGTLERTAALAVDSGVHAQMLQAAASDLQARRPGSGVADQSNAFDVQGRVVDDGAAGTPLSLAAGQPVVVEASAPINRTGEPLRLNVAHALRNQAREAGIAAAVVPHASGRGYNVVPQLPAPAAPVAQAAPGVVAAQGGAPFATRTVAQAELQRQGLEASREMAPAGGDAPLGFVVPPKAPTTGAAPVVEQRHATWRTNAIQAGRVARGLGINPKGKRLAQVVAEIDAADAQRAGVAQDGSDLSAGNIDREWSAFAPETGSLGVPRAEMPQIKAEHRGALVNFLKARGIDSRAEEVPANDLKPTQAEFSQNKVERARAFKGGDRSILVSSDGYVVDGHHQWLAKRANGEPVKMIRLQAPIRQVLAQTAEFPSTASGRGAQLQDSPSSRGAASTTTSSRVFAPELVAVGADVSGAGGESNSSHGGGQQQDRATRLSLRQEPTENQVPTLDQKAPVAIKSGDNSSAPSPSTARAAAPRSATRIGDFGEELKGARKMLYAEAYADGMAKAKELDTKAHPLSKTWPEPEYGKLLEGGASLQAVSMVRAMRDAVPTKPQASWKLKGWASKVEALRGFSEDILAGRIDPGSVTREMERVGIPRVTNQAALYEALGHDRSMKGIELSSASYSMYDGVRFDPPRTIWTVAREAKGSAFGNWPRELAKGDTREAAIASFKKRASELLAEEQAPTKGATFEIYSKRAGGAREFFIGKKIGRNVAELKAGFQDLKVARQYLAGHQTELEGLLTKYKAVPPVRNDQNAPRIGQDYRKGADVTPEQFQDTFGFRGVQFGNYVEGARRQQDLNQAYDALMDLAGVLNLPPRALSLGGRLGLAFGARGAGGVDAAAAHYERGEVVINLTKKQGAGSLAHEWWHGLDNYFSRQRGDGGSYMTEDSRRGDGVREDMRAAFRDVISAINRTGMHERSRKLDDRRAKEYWTTKPEMSARAFESYVIAKLQDQSAGNDYLANVVGASVFALEDAYPYPTAGELPQIRGVFEAFFQTVETRKGEGGAEVLYSISSEAAPARGLSVEQAQQAVQQALSGLRNPPPIDIVARSEELGADAPQGVMGAAIPSEGRIVIVASAHRSADAVVETLFHEMFHLGLRNVLPAQDYVQAMLDLARRDSRVQEYANRWKKEAPDASQQLQVLREQGHTGSELTAHYEALAIEEGLAVVAEELRARKQAGTKLGLRVRTLANWLASVAERMGMQRLADSIRKMTYNEAERFVLKAIEHAGRASGDQDGMRFRTVDPVQTPAFKRWFGDSKVVRGGRALAVYHGTGGDFSVFSRDRAGATTGAANAGMGFFFTDRPEVAGSYARMGGGAQNIMPVYLSLQNPLRLEASNMMQADKLLEAELQPEHDGAIIQVAMHDGGTQTVYMVRQTRQVKSAIGNNGQFDPNNPDIRFRARGDNPAAQRVGDALHSLTVTNIKQQTAFKAADLRPLSLQFLGRRQLVDVYGDMLPELRTYSDLMARMDADKNEAGVGADQLAQDWARLPDERQLAELMHDATLAQMDPARDYQDGDNRLQYGALRKRFDALTPAARDVYARARDIYRQHMRDVRAAIKERIERAEMSSERRAAMLKRLDDEFFGRIKGVYFPLARFGQYVVVVRGADGKVENVSRAETMAEADTLRRQLLTAFPQAKGFTVGKVLKARDFVAERDSVGRGFMEQLYSVLDKQGMDAAQRAELEDALGQLYLSSLPDLSWAKHGIHRKGTPGFSQDARRAFAQNVFHGASYLAKLRYGDQLQDQLAEMQRRVDAGASDEDFNSVKAQQVVDEMAKRHDAAMSPKTSAVSTALTSMGFMFYLGLSPASAMVNLTQTAMVAYPIMAARWGYRRAGAALLQASQAAARGRNDITASLNPDEKAAFEEAVRSGVVDVTMAHDLAGIAQGEDRNVSYKLRPAMRAASFLFHHAEKFNRQVTFVAAYRLAREGGAGRESAYQQAVQATYDGHFDYSSNNRPRVMQGNVARVLLLFKQYGQNMIYTLVRNAQQSLQGATPEVRAEARKALGGLLAMHGMAAGVLGLPMVTTLLAAASMLGGDDDEPWDAQVALRNMLADTFGQKPAEVLAHGLSRLTPWDISGRVGMDKLIFPDVQEGLEGQRLAESAMTAALGPVAGIGVNVLKGLQEMSEGRYQRGLETMVPSALRGPLKAWRYETEGVKDKTGIMVQDEVDAAALWGQAAGFSPSSVRNAYEGKAAVVGNDRALMARRSSLVEQFAMAAMAGDEAGKTEAREAIQRFNEKNPRRRILPMQLARSVAARQKRIREAREGVYLPTKRRDAVEQGRFAAG